MTMSSKILYVFLLFVSVSVNAADWDYSEGANGPANWVDNYPDCGGNSQSPIQIVTTEAVLNQSLGLFERSAFYTPPTSMELTNNGHSLQMNIQAGNPTINDATLLPFEAKLAQYHFHWAATANGGGSEHKLDSDTRFGELHLVHYNTKYADLSTAASESDGLAVLGFFLKTGYPQDNEAMDQIFDLLNQVPYKGNTTTISTKFSIESILPPLETGLYYRYKGSLTTPGCSESVLWTVFQEDIQISNAQADKLAAALYDNTDSSSAKIKNNFRPTQPLNDRKVTKPYQLVQDSGASGIRPSIVAIIVTGILAIYM